MHIAMIAPEQIPVPPLGGGSVEICMLAIAERLAGGHRVTLISRRHPRYPRISRHGNLTIVRVAGRKPATYIASAARYLQEHPADWIQIDNRPRYVPFIRNRLGATPVSLFLHSLTYVSRPMIVPLLASSCMASADLIVVNSMSLGARLQERFPQFAEVIRKVHLGVDLDRFAPPTPQQKTKLQEAYGVRGRFVVAFAGRLIPRKGIPVLLRAFRQVKLVVPSARLLVAGGAQQRGYKTRLVRLARKLRLGPGVRFVGVVPHGRMHRVYRAADCFVCPSQKHEAFGLVNVEAMACGIPCVASDNGGIREIVVHDRNGCLIEEYAKPDRFAATLVRLATDRQWREQLGAQAREDAAALFDWQQTADRLAALYESHLAQRMTQAT
ncbi:glycosyltransferase family 4 protein [Paenibacillus cymbidii]|uniref:glycosyltransferase family 4 protein n=1 Tax=Paenibacillus cymbidii TaxID=1639034 RepID=UPI001081AF49|nr:glycosyltransferase family 4 protein [Paenibacillus cymbidii]